MTLFQIPFLRRRRAKKEAETLLHSARHYRNMREDIAPRDVLQRVLDAEAQLKTVLKNGDTVGIERAGAPLAAVLHSVILPVRFAGWRENLEVLVIAVAVAMAFRTYFLQPFKIPTGSMQPWIVCRSPW